VGTVELVGLAFHSAVLLPLLLLLHLIRRPLALGLCERMAVFGTLIGLPRDVGATNASNAAGFG